MCTETQWFFAAPALAFLVGIFYLIRTWNDDIFFFLPSAKGYNSALKSALAMAFSLLGTALTSSLPCGIEVMFLFYGCFGVFTFWLLFGVSLSSWAMPNKPMLAPLIVWVIPAFFGSLIFFKAFFVVLNGN